MNKENTYKLVKRFPVMYQGFYDSMTETCMCWGFDVGDGWFDIIWQLSLAIEDELGETKFQTWKFLFLKKWSKKWNGLVYKISPVGTKDIFARFFEALRRRVLGEKPDFKTHFARRWYLLGQSFAMLENGIKHLSWHPYTGFAVTQVKEKYGTLRFYSPGNDRIFHLIDLAERASELTCEQCGKHGKLLGQGWYYTACEECCHEEDKEQFNERMWEYKEQVEELTTKNKELKLKIRALKLKLKK